MSRKIKVLDPRIGGLAVIDFEPVDPVAILPGEGELRFGRPDLAPLPFAEVQLFALFQSNPREGSKVHLLLFQREHKRPLLVEIGQLHLHEFPLPKKESSVESLRLFGRYLSHCCPAAAVDRETYQFLATQRPPKVLERRVHDLATALGKLLWGEPEATAPMPSPEADEPAAVASGEEAEPAAANPYMWGAQAKAYAPRELLGYGFRGKALGLLGLSAAAWAVLEVPLLKAAIGAAGTGGFVARLLALWVLAAVFFEIVDSTAQGRREPAGWPAFFAVKARSGELMTLVAGGLVLALPLVGLRFLLRWLGWQSVPLAAVLSTVLALPLCALALLAFGAAGAWRHPWFAPRLDLHLRALLALALEAAKTAVWLWVPVTTLLAVVSLGLGGLEPVAGELRISRLDLLLAAVLSGAISAYFFVLAAHLVGDFFRRHANRLSAVYLPKL